MIPASLPPTFTPITPDDLTNLGGASGLGGDDPAAALGGGGAGGSFSTQLQGALQQMEQLQSSASQQVNNLVGGKSGDVHASMIAVEKSDLAFSMMLQLRNKAVDAYQQVAQMSF